MTRMRKHEDQRLLLSCGVVALLGTSLLVLFGALFLAVETVDRERQVVRYPGSEPVSSHSNYSGLPFDLRWDNAYRTTDEFVKVYNWYSSGFDLGAEIHALDRCIHLEGADRWLAVKRHISVILCDTPTARMIFVTRSTTLR